MRLGLSPPLLRTIHVHYAVTLQALPARLQPFEFTNYVPTRVILLPWTQTVRRVARLQWIEKIDQHACSTANWKDDRRDQHVGTNPPTT